MADVTTTYKLGDIVVPASKGRMGFYHFRVQHDGSGVSFPVVLPASSGIKTIRGCVGQIYSHNIPNAGVAAGTGFTVKFGASTDATFLDLLIFGEG